MDDGNTNYHLPLETLVECQTNVPEYAIELLVMSSTLFAVYRED
jgi:hypothetical protein